MRARSRAMHGLSPITEQAATANDSAAPDSREMADQTASFVKENPAFVLVIVGASLLLAGRCIGYGLGYLRARRKLSELPREEQSLERR